MEFTPTVSRKYARLLAQMRTGLARDIEWRFRVGRLVDEAIGLGVPLARVSKDLDVGTSVLENYRRAFLFWGDDRIPGDRAIWGDYSAVARWVTRSGGSPEWVARAESAKQAMLAGERPGEVRWRFSHFVEHLDAEEERRRRDDESVARAARAPRSARQDFRMALNELRRIEDDAVRAEIVREVLDELRAMGLVAISSRRVLRAAA